MKRTREWASGKPGSKLFRAGFRPREAGFYYLGAHPAIYHLQRAIEDEGKSVTRVLYKVPSCVRSLRVYL